MCRLCDLVGAGRPRLFDVPDTKQESVPQSGVPDSTGQAGIESEQGASEAAQQKELDPAAVSLPSKVSGSNRP